MVEAEERRGRAWGCIGFDDACLPATYVSDPPLAAAATRSSQNRPSMADYQAIHVCFRFILLSLPAAYPSTSARLSTARFPRFHPQSPWGSCLTSHSSSSPQHSSSRSTFPREHTFGFLHYTAHMDLYIADSRQTRSLSVKSPSPPSPASSPVSASSPCSAPSACTYSRSPKVSNHAPPRTRRRPLGIHSIVDAPAKFALDTLPIACLLASRQKFELRKHPRYRIS